MTAAAIVLAWVVLGVVSARIVQRHWVLGRPEDGHTFFCASDPTVCDCPKKFVPYAALIFGPLSALALLAYVAINVGQPPRAMTKQEERKLRRKVEQLERDLGIGPR